MLFLLLVLMVAALSVLVAVSAGHRTSAAFLAVFAATVPFGSAIAVPGLPGPFGTVSTLVGVLTAGALILTLATGATPASDLDPSLPFWLLLTGVAALTAAWSVDPATTVADVLVLVSLVAIYLPVALLRFSESELVLIEGGIVGGGAIAGVVAAVQLATGTLDTKTNVPRFTLAGGGGEVGDANVTAATLLLPLAVAIAMLGREDGPDGPARWLVRTAVVLSATGIVLTGSRGGLLATAVMLVVMGVAGRRSYVRPAYMLVGVSLLAVALLISPEAIQERVQETGSTGRYDIWLLGLSKCPEYCLLGSGYGTFPEVQGQAWLEHPRGGGYEVGYEAHNMFLQALVEAGVVGLVLLVGGLLVVARELRRRHDSRRVAALAGLAGVVVANLFLSNFAFKYFWLVLMYAVLARMGSARDEVHRTAAAVTA